MKYAVVTKHGVEIVEAENMLDAIMLLPLNEEYEPLAIVKTERDE